MRDISLRERSIFLKAVELDSPSALAKYLDESCGDNDGLRRAVLALLEANQQAGDVFDESAIRPAVGGSQIAEKPGTMIGPYKLREQIGEGGFGVVYVAEQETPIRRKVALKIIKPGMDTQQVIARFEAERQALALMDHPNVAQVLDAAATESGRPYFVMELVRGVPFTEFCDDHKLSTRERLELFVDVCGAVQHAHQKGIIHRDLKPSNILATLHDDKRVVKVIDFGVAKALSEKLTEKTVYTAFGQLIGTPMYMSPEQAQLSGLDVDTRSDVYSLGVLLYELLTGTTPFDEGTFKRVEFDELRRIIREDEPLKPSARVSTLKAEQLSTVCEVRRLDARKLSSSLHGELDWIVMKALEKDRSRRYETASKFAEDVQHYLNDEAVMACPPSASYRFRKFVGRNKALISTTIAVAFLLILGIIGTTWQAIRATQERDRAVAAEARAAERASEAEFERNRAVAAEMRAKSSVARIQKMTRDVLGQLGSYEMRGKAWAKLSFGRGLMQAGQTEEGRQVLDEYYQWAMQNPDNPRAEAVKGVYNAMHKQPPAPNAKMTCQGRRFNGEYSFGLAPGLYFDGVPPWTIEVIATREATESRLPGAEMDLFSWTDGGGMSLCTIGTTHWAFWVGKEMRGTYAQPKALQPSPLNVRQHFACVWDGSFATLFIDGVKQASEPAPSEDVLTVVTGLPMYIGADGTRGSDVWEFFVGTIQCLRVTRAALYSEDFAPPSNLEPIGDAIALYDFRYDEGDYAYDRSGNGNHAILVNTEPIPLDD